MLRPFQFLLGCAAAAVVAVASPGAPAGSAKVDFASQIQPILSKKCYQCHGPDEGSRKAKLRLDSFDEAIRDRKGSRAVVPGNTDASALTKRIVATDPEEVMPPPETKNPLSAVEVDLLRRWIAQGAAYTKHWAWTAPERPALPAVKQRSWPRTGLDHFVLQKLEENGLKPSPPADRYTLARRLSLDLTGLPPTPAEVEEFVLDRRPDAYERLVDRLLASPHFGERWARVWLDLARYADSAGYGSDPLRPNIWPWRDWLIGALNRNEPFDEFTRDLIAGDLVEKPTEDQLIATAFHRNTMTNTEGGTDDEEWRVAAVKDRASVTAQVWMGLTMNCAQCHTHKFDPITHHDYYSFFAFFNQSEDNDQPDERPTMPVYSPAEKARRAELKAEIVRVEQEYVAPNAAFETELAAWAERAAKPVDWKPLKALAAVSTLTNGASLSVAADGTVSAAGNSPERDTYVITAEVSAPRLTALLLEALPDDALPGRGPGRATNGHFVLNDLRVEVTPAKVEPVAARYVRVEAPGDNRMLSLAEVQVFSAGRNAAPDGTATQSSTDYLGDANRAVDGNTDGNYEGARSTTHTRAEKDPWWEVDLGSAQSITEVAVWNRTDGGAASRLANAKLILLDGDRKSVWEGKIESAPAPVVKLGPAAPKPLRLANASADLEQKDFPAAEAIDGDAGRNSGWGIASGAGQPHRLAVELAEPLALAGPVRLTITMGQNFGERHTLGHFRLATTDQPVPVRVFPADVQAVLATLPGERTPAQHEALAAYYRPQSATLGSKSHELAALRTQLEAVRGTPLPVMRDLAADRARVTHVLNKGNFLDPADEVRPAVPAAFNFWPTGAPTNRLGLAAWLTSAENPLTARVAVNRFWAQLMGIAIVETEEDFGTQGTLPGNRALLDWLAVSFQSPKLPAGAPADPFNPQLGWDFKALLKQIVSSATYRQSSAVSPELLLADPQNRLYARASRRRLDAETVRDQALALSGLLSRKLGGPSVYPAQPDGLWRAAFNGERSWSTSEGEDRYRRGIYTFWRRTVPYPSMATFDAPSRETCTLRRQPTNTPLQAFVTLNDPVFVESAQALGRQLALESGTVDDRIRSGLQRVLGRPITPEQATALRQLFDLELANYRQNPKDALLLAVEPMGPLPTELDPAEAAAWTTLANVLLNLDGVLTKG